jgi:hypothetical protein
MPVWTPWPCSWSPCPQLRGWPLTRGTMRSCRGKGSSGSWQRKRGVDTVEHLWGMRIEWGARLQEQVSSSPQPLQVLPLGYPHRVSEDGKWVREGCFSDWGKHTCKHTQLSFSPCSQWTVCPAACTAAAAAAAGAAAEANIGSLSNLTIKSWQDPHKSLWTQNLIPRPPYEL